MNDGVVALHVWEEAFCVRAYESGVRNRVTLASYCNYLQEAAGNHAHELGLGIEELQQEGFTWMLGRLRLEVGRYVAWRDAVAVRTWPAGARGRLTAVRDFVVESAGETVLRGASEWLYVELAAQRVVRLPGAFAALAPEGTPRAGVPEEAGRLPEPGEAVWRAEVGVRQSDHDFNRHVNNAHYVEWALECLPPEWRAGREAGELDIVFRQAARWGDTVVSEAALAEDGAVLHRMRRAADGVTLAVARTVWRGEHGD